MIGVNFEDNHVATGFGNHLARPILCDEWHENLTFEEGVKLLEKCMRVLLYRDRSAVNKLQVSLLIVLLFLYMSEPSVLRCVNKEIGSVVFLLRHLLHFSVNYLKEFFAGLLELIEFGSN